MDENPHKIEVGVMLPGPRWSTVSAVFDAAMALHRAWQHFDIRIDPSSIGDKDAERVIKRFAEMCHAAEEVERG